MRVVFILIVLLGCVNMQRFGPFKVAVRGVTSCKYQGTHFRMFDTKVGVKKRNAPLVLNTNFSNQVPVDDTVEASIVSAVWGNGGWKENFWSQKLGGLCSSLRILIPDVFQRLLQSMNLKSCLIPVGNHSVNNFELKATFNIPIAPYGKYKADIKFGNKRFPNFGCINVSYDVLTKKGHIHN